MTLEEVIAKANDEYQAENAAFSIPYEVRRAGAIKAIANAVRAFLGSDEVVKRAGHALQEAWSFADDAGLHALPDIEFSEHEREYLARAALSSIGGE